MATVKSLKADVSSASPLSSHSHHGLMLETSTFKLFTVAIITQLIILNYPVILSHQHSTKAFVESYPLYSFDIVGIYPVSKLFYTIAVKQGVSPVINL